MTDKEKKALQRKFKFFKLRRMEISILTFSGYGFKILSIQRMDDYTRSLLSFWVGSYDQEHKRTKTINILFFRKRFSGSLHDK